MTKSRREQSPADERGDRLELDEDLPFQRRERVMRRVGTAILCAFLLAAFVGLFGAGPLSKAEARSADASVSAVYERFTRNRASTTLHVRLHAPTAGRPVELTLNSAFAEAVHIEQILPEPSSVATASGRYVFQFASTPSDTARGIVLRYRPESLGSVRIVAAVAGSELQFRQFVYP